MDQLQTAVTMLLRDDGPDIELELRTRLLVYCSSSSRSIDTLKGIYAKMGGHRHGSINLNGQQKRIWDYIMHLVYNMIPSSSSSSSPSQMSTPPPVPRSDVRDELLLRAPKRPCPELLREGLAVIDNFLASAPSPPSRRPRSESAALVDGFFASAPSPPPRRSRINIRNGNK